MSTRARERELTVPAIGKEKVSTGSNAHKPRVSEQMRDAVNQVSTPLKPLLVSPQKARKRHFWGCRMQVGQEACQVKHRGQTIRLYVQRNKEGMV